MKGKPRWLERLERLPRLGVFLGTLVFALAVFFVPGIIGAVLVGLLAVGVAILVMATWAHRTPAERGIRLLLLGALVVIAASKVM